MLASKDRDGTKIDFLSLDAIGQTIVILERLEKGGITATTEDLIELAQGEASVIRAHLLYFKQMDWIEQGPKKEGKGAGTGGGEWRLTEIGKSSLGTLRANWSEKPL